MTVLACRDSAQTIRQRSPQDLRGETKFRLQRYVSPAGKDIVGILFDGIQDAVRTCELIKRVLNREPSSGNQRDTQLGLGVQLPCPIDLEPQEGDDRRRHMSSSDHLFRDPICTKLILRKIHATHPMILSDIPKNIRQLHRGAELCRVPECVRRRRTEDMRHDQSHDRRNPVAVDLEISKGREPARGQVHLHPVQQLIKVLTRNVITADGLAQRDPACRDIVTSRTHPQVHRGAGAICRAASGIRSVSSR